MKSQWYGLKPKAIKLRQNGRSIRFIESRLKIPRSTLSLWFRGIILTDKQKSKLKKEWLKGLVKARVKAVIWHNAQKAIRITEAKLAARNTFKKLNISDRNIIELAVSMLYLGEGNKKGDSTSIGNSNPLILKFFISALKLAYDYDQLKIKCELHLRSDQNADQIRKYWAKELNLPLKNFTSISIDQRTRGSKTYLDYKGVCVLQCGSISIQRRLVFLSNLFCDKIIQHGRVAQLVRATR